MASNEQTSVGIDRVKWVLSALALSGAGYANAVYGQDISALYRFMGLTALLLLVLFVLSTTSHGRYFLELAKEARQEMRKVVWPTKNETLVTSGFVVVVVAIFSMALWVVDSILRAVIAAILG